MSGAKEVREARRSCKKCRHFYMDGEGWELPQFDYPSCKAHAGMANLKSFPFQDTKCPKYHLKEPDK